MLDLNDMLVNSMHIDHLLAVKLKDRNYNCHILYCFEFMDIIQDNNKPKVSQVFFLTFYEIVILH